MTLGTLASFIAEQVNAVSRDPWEARPILRRNMVVGTDKLFNRADIDRILDQAGSDPLPFYLVREQHMPSKNDYPTRADVDRMYADGHTAVAFGIQRHTPAIAQLCQAVMGLTGIPSFGGAYITPPTSQGFKPHWDLGSVTVIQTHGSKDWVIGRPVITTDQEMNIPWSVRGFSEAEQARPPHSIITLEQGDVLFLPRAWVHSARATGEASVHVSIGALHKGIDLDSCRTVFP